MSYGSWNTGLLIPDSDIDLCIQGFEGVDRQGVIKILETIENNLRLFKWIKTIKPIYTATLPIIKIEACASIEFESFDVGVSNIGSEDIIKRFTTVNDENTKNLLNPKVKSDIIIHVDLSVEHFDDYRSCNVGLRTTNYIIQSIAYYDGLREIAIMIKLWLSNLGLNCGYKGGLNSYAICLMIISYFEYIKSIDMNHCTGTLLYKFLEFYGKEFDPKTKGICLNYTKIDGRSPYFDLTGFVEISPVVLIDPTNF